jgi:hypothetical protein
MFYDWLRIFCGGRVEHPCVAVCSTLCVGKKDKKEIKTLGSPPGDLDEIFFLHQRSWKSPLEEYYDFAYLPSVSPREILVV